MEVLFYIFSAIMIVLGLGVVVSRNPVTSAMCLVGSFVGLAALFIQLDAFFIGIIQILVYAGAVMVLFLFIIMLLDLKAEEKKSVNYMAFAGGLILALVFMLQLSVVLSNFESGDVGFTPMTEELTLEKDLPGLPETANRRLREDKLPDVHLVGRTLFTRYNFPLQVVGVLLLVSTVGVILLSKRKLS